MRCLKTSNRTLLKRLRFWRHESDDAARLENRILKKILRNLSAAIVGCAFLASAQSTNDALLIYVELFERETPQTVLRFHRTHVVSSPVSNWPVFASFTNTVQGSNGTITELPVGMQFYACSLSNELGIVFSSDLWLKLPSQVGALKVQRVR